MVYIKEYNNNLKIIIFIKQYEYNNMTWYCLYNKDIQTKYKWIYIGSYDKDLDVLFFPGYVLCVLSRCNYHGIK